MLFQLHGSIGYFVEMLLSGFKSHKPLHQLSQKQFIKMADHSCLMVGQRDKVVVLMAETKSITTTQKRFQPIFLNCWSPARNFACSKHLKRKRIICTLWMWGLLKLWEHCVWQSSTALANQQGRQLMSMECLNAQWKEYFKWIWKCSYTKISVMHNLSDNKERWLQITDWADGKDKILFNKWFLDEAYFYLYRTVNKLSTWFGGTESPEISMERADKEEKSPFGFPWPTMA